MSAEYKFREIEKKWQKYWEENQTFRASDDFSLPKYYVLDMFPYPSGAGLHVGHPLGYIASDIVTRYKRLKGFNVLHPMGYDAFGLPAEQYAIQTGQHPAITTKNNIIKFREQLDNLGLSFDWSREVKTSDPNYYKWTQWIFLKLLNSWYNKDKDKAEPIECLIKEFEKKGNSNINAVTSDDSIHFSAQEWNSCDEKKKQNILFNYRIAYQSESSVNWCPQLGTVLANEEVKDGLSERGGYPVIKKTMKQWFLRITAYAERLLQGLNSIDWSDAVKEMQRNWIGKSEGCLINFQMEDSENFIDVFTTRPDTLFGSTFIVLAPEHELALKICSPGYKKEVEQYIELIKVRSERERISDVKTITGQFTGRYALHPFTHKKLPVWVADYVIAGYGTGAIMAVPAHDSRDFAFAKYFDLEIIEVVKDVVVERRYDHQSGDESTPHSFRRGVGGEVLKEAFESQEGKMINSDFLNGLEVKEAIQIMIKKVEEKKTGVRKINFRLRDAGFSRQRYWGEPFPVYYKNNILYGMDESELPLILPEVKTYFPTGTGEGPLLHAHNWINLSDGSVRDTDTMPGWAGSNWYFLRYMDPHNRNEFVSKKSEKYWGDVDLYIGGNEHATGHLLYSRFCYKFLYDLGYVSKEEPFAKLVNQGMIQGRSNIVYRVKGTNTFVSHFLRKEYKTTPLHVDVNIVENDILDIDAFRKWNPEYVNTEFILEEGKYHCGVEIEKMSKSRFNVVNPEHVIEKYGADTLRLYEMFLGPLEQSKPWNTHGIEGVFKFLKKCWRLFYNVQGEWVVNGGSPTLKELKILHKTIQKIEYDITKFSFNTSVSSLMICVNELTECDCHNKNILESLLIILSPFAPHLCEELWQKFGHQTTISFAKFPVVKPEYLKEDSFEYPVSVNGKLRAKITLPLDYSNEEIEKSVLTALEIKKWLNGAKIKKIIIVKGRIVNLVIEN